MRVFTFVIAALLFLFVSNMPVPAQEKRLITGFDGGMMIHTGYLNGTLGPEMIPASGAPFGLGGVARPHLGKNVTLPSGPRVYFGILFYR